LQYHALAAAVNIVHGSDANRVLAFELKAVYPAIHAMSHANDDGIIEQASMLLANIAHNNSFTGAAIISHGGDRALQIAIQITSSRKLAASCISTMANLCTNETNQSHLGAENGMLDMIIRLERLSTDTELVKQTARLILGLAWKHTSNKARLAMQGACQALLGQISRICSELTSVEDEEKLQCLDFLAAALASILLNPWTQHKLDELQGVQEVTYP
jgi:hypothetical protein